MTRPCYYTQSPSAPQSSISFEPSTIDWIGTTCNLQVSVDPTRTRLESLPRRDRYWSYETGSLHSNAGKNTARQRFASQSHIVGRKDSQNDNRYRRRLLPISPEETDHAQRACQHNSAEWHDCRISIDCRSLAGWCDDLPRRAPNDVKQSANHRSRLGKPIGLTNGIDQSTVVRSVRLTIDCLNPIYRRRSRLAKLVGAVSAGDQSNGLGPVVPKLCHYQQCQNQKRSQSDKSNKSVWSKLLVQKMVFETDDFKIPDDKVKNAKDVFNQYDKRNQGKISTTDLGTAFRALKVKFKAETVKEWADEIDVEATGSIELEGFLQLYGKILQEEQDEHYLRDAFRIFSGNKGEIDVDVLRWILKELGDDLTEDEIDDMIHDTDTDDSGFVDFDEFYKLMTSE